jgi:hypothetical protein
MPAYCALTSSAAKAVAPTSSAERIGNVPRRLVDRDVTDLPGRQAAVAPQEGQVDRAAHGQQLLRPDGQRTWAAAPSADPPNIRAPEAGTCKAAVPQTVGRGI